MNDTPKAAVRERLAEDVAEDYDAISANLIEIAPATCLAGPPRLHACES